MNQKYEKLMVQHGGYIPFSSLGGSHHKDNDKKSKKKDKSKKIKKKRRTNKFKKKRVRMTVQKKKGSLKKELCVCEKDPSSDNPSRFGHHAQCLQNNVIIKGANNTLWKVKDNEWVKL